MTLTDPITNLIFCRIRNPKLQISGFNNHSNCIDLHKFMKEKNKTPEFGFQADPIIDGKLKDPWLYMKDIILPKDR